MPAAFFVVRATVTDPAKRAAFDNWYAKEHLPDAMKSLREAGIAVLERDRSQRPSGDVRIRGSGFARPRDERG
jgi:hypothetical protein